MLFNKENSLTSWLPLECSKKWTIKSNSKPDISSRDGIPTEDLKFTQSMLEEPLYKGISPWEDLGQGSFMGIVMPTTKLIWLSKRLKNSVSLPSHWLWKEMVHQEVALDLPTSHKKDLKKNITLMKVFLSNRLEFISDINSIYLICLCSFASIRFMKRNY